MNATAGHVFVSHSSDNRELANELAAFLEARGSRIWIAPRDVRPGMDYSEQLQLAIESCVAFVVLVTDMANKSPYVRAETEMAFSTHKPIFPVRISDVQPAAGLALFLKIRHWTDAYGASKSGNLDRLALELQALSVASAGAAAAETPAQPSPAPPPAPPPPAQPLMGSGAAAPTPVAALPLVPANAEEEEKWRAAIGPKAEHYLTRFKVMAAKNSAINWNWSACLASLFWFGYRKMWLPMIGVLVVSVLLSVIGGANPQAGRAMFLVSIGITFVTGAFGNHLYRRQIARLVAGAQGADRQAVLDNLRSRGGVSIPALVISLVILGLFVLVVLLAGIQAAQEEQNRLDALNAFNMQQQDPYSTGEPAPDKPVDEDPPPYDY